MKLNIEEQIPIRAKFLNANRIFIPGEIKKALNWEIGDELELYATEKGIFLRRSE